MISIDEALNIIRSHCPPPRRQKMPLLQAVGRVVAEDIVAGDFAPRFDNSAMDGFALRFDDIVDKEALHIVGESKAGRPFNRTLKKGEAVCISTGAMLPAGADTVVPVEECRVQDGRLFLSRDIKKGQHVRYRGEEITPGELLVKAGSILYPERIGLLASQGVEEVNVYTPPRVALITTGSEIGDQQEKLAEHEIHNSNMPMLETAISLMGAELVLRAHVGDDLDSTSSLFQKAVDRCDLIVTCGGVSMGEHDYVRQAAERCGLEKRFWKISQQPGKPFYFATKERLLFFGLAGNPVSAFMGFIHYVTPTLRFLQGGSFSWPRIEALAREDKAMTKKRSQLWRVRLQPLEDKRFGFHILKRQASHMLTSISEADGYIIIHPGMSIRVGEVHSVYLFPWRCNDGLYRSNMHQS